MATQTIYNITFEGLFLDPSGNQIPTGENGVTIFNNLDEVNTFIVAIGSNGIYNVVSYIKKYTPEV